MWFEDAGRADIARVGGKNASLGELTRALTKAGVRVPPGFAVTAHAYRTFIDANHLRDDIGSALESFTQARTNLA